MLNEVTSLLDPERGAIDGGVFLGGSKAEKINSVDGLILTQRFYVIAPMSDRRPKSMDEKQWGSIGEKVRLRRMIGVRDRLTTPNPVMDGVLGPVVGSMVIWVSEVLHPLIVAFCALFLQGMDERVE